MNRPIRALLLSAGFGKRLRPLTLYKPKCLMEIDKKPILEHWLDKLENINIDRILINTHYLSNQVDDFLDNYYFKNYKIEKFHEKELLGTAGTLIANYKFFLNYTGMIIHSDNYTKMNLIDFVKSHNKRPKNCLITMLTFKTNRPNSCGIVELDSEGVVQSFHEKVSSPPGNIANGAIYLFDNDFLEWLIENHPNACDFSTEVIPFLLGRIYTYHTNDKYIDIGTIEALKEARKIENNKNSST